MHNDLVGGAVRLHLPSQCLPCVQVHELGEHHVLVACASAESVHCLLLPHPVALWQVRTATSLSPQADMYLTAVSLLHCREGHGEVGLPQCCSPSLKIPCPE